MRNSWLIRVFIPFLVINLYDIISYFLYYLLYSFAHQNQYKYYFMISKLLFFISLFFLLCWISFFSSVNFRFSFSLYLSFFRSTQIIDFAFNVSQASINLVPPKHLWSLWILMEFLALSFSFYCLCVSHLKTVVNWSKS